MNNITIKNKISNIPDELKTCKWLDNPLNTDDLEGSGQDYTTTNVLQRVDTESPQSQIVVISITKDITAYGVIEDDCGSPWSVVVEVSIVNGRIKGSELVSYTEDAKLVAAIETAQDDIGVRISDKIQVSRLRSQKLWYRIYKYICNLFKRS
jgi:hypothetical protein